MKPINVLFCILVFSISVSAQDARIKVAVNDLVSRGIDSNAAAVFSDRLRAELVNTGRFRVMERAEMISILKEQGFQNSGACDEASCLVQVGQLLGVENIVAGSVGRISDLYSVSLRFISVKTGEIMFTVSEDREGGMKEILTDVIPASAVKMARKATLSGGKSENGELVGLRTDHAAAEEDTLNGNVSPNLKLKIRQVDEMSLACFSFDQNGDEHSDLTGVHSAVLVGAVQTNGYSGRGVRCTEGAYIRLGHLIPDRTPQGTIELFVKPADSFVKSGIYSIFGNRGARIHLIYNNGTLYFQKNHSDKHIHISAQVNLEPGKWYKISAAWGAKGMRLFLNDEVISYKQETSGYRLSSDLLQKYGIFHLGYKQWCCMDAIGIHSRSKSHYFDGIVDELHISKIDRY